MKQTFGKYELEAECVIIKPDQEDFDQGLSSLALQYGADFILHYKDNKEKGRTLGMLQFIKASTEVGNPPRSDITGIALDSQIQDGIRPITDYLFGDIGTRITYERSCYYGRPTCRREINECEICDCPREIMRYGQDKTFQLPAAVCFWNFLVEIQKDFGVIYSKGVKWGYEIKQIGETNYYETEISEFRETTLSQIDYERIFSGHIDPKSYHILKP